ncbi:MAG TPA: hydantoinase/oxoprolinase family protein [Acidimicrobiales bacterium]|nr:hydantoinase/oxoprolinase family protein [Acidimicrobiales bacterium]
MRAGADTGGTFTDIVGDDGRVAKVLSTPDDPSRAVGDALEALGAEERPDLLAHGTTVATNALLERRGAKVALVTTDGFADVIEIARQDRPSLYDIEVDRPEPLVPRDLRLEVGGRLGADGDELEPVDPSSVPEVPEDVESVAVCLLHADLDPSHEKAVADALAERGVEEVTCSHQVSPEFREYERTVTTVVNAYLRPRCRRYLRALSELAEDVLVMTSAGGLLPADEAAELAVALLLSGPAGGARAGALAAEAAGFPDAVTFDMGGTSTDVCLVQGGVPEPAPGRIAAGFPIRLPALDIHTIGAGGGSIAGLDPGGALVVGPESAGADPGPACYGRGGEKPTVTDADLVLGRFPEDAAFGGLDALDRDAAERALEKAGVDADGVVRVVDASMQRAVRVVSVQRGVDPGGLALVAFGGAGPLHACAVAEGAGMAAVVVPPRAGVLSAVGLLCSPRQRDLVRSWPDPGECQGLDDAVAELAEQAAAAVGGGDDVDVTTSLDCRYAGQSHELTVAKIDDFADEHRRRNGYARPGAPVEVVALRARGRTPPAVTVDDLGPPPTRRQATKGPAVVAEPDCTVWVPEGWSADVASDGSWVLTR